MKRPVGRHYKKRKPVTRLRFIIRRIVAAAAAVALVMGVVFGFAVADRMRSQQLDLLTAISDVARDNNLGPVVAIAENIYYGVLNAPKVGGNPTGPASFDGSTRGTTGNGLIGKVSAHPKANFAAWGAANSPSKLPESLVSPVAPTKLEGQWIPTKIAVNGVTAMYVARVRPDSIHTSMFATVAWMDPHLLAFEQVSGTKLPEGNFSHGNGRVLANLRPFYMAGFADGYRMKDSQGGAIINGVTVKPLVVGKATLLTYPDGSIDIVQWGRDTYRKGFSVARQNLDLMVDAGKSQVLNEDQAKWGLVWYGTGSGKNYIWRSALGLRADGTVVYVQSQALSAGSLADLLVRAGAVRGMALDMNKAFANGDLYGPYGPKGKAINPDNQNPTDRFYKSSTRDFVAVFAKSPRIG